MSRSDLYPYASRDVLETRNVYSYSPYHGAPFLGAWAESRAAATKAHSVGPSNLSEVDTPTLRLVKNLRPRLSVAPRDGDAWEMLDRLVQRFEVTKRVHDDYREDWRAVDRSSFRAMPAYLELSEAFLDAFRLTGQLTYLNVLLKALDTLSGLFGDLSRKLQSRVEYLIEHEAICVAKLTATVNAAIHPNAPILPAVEKSENAGNVVLLGCESARSRAYLEAMCNAGLAPSRVLIMGPETLTPPVRQAPPQQWHGLYLPSLSEPLSAICEREHIDCTHLPERDVNASSTCEALCKVSEDLIIYSGVGGQIVSERALGAGPRFMHFHSGWLPDYRGSTTFYYAILNNDLPAVSSLYLDPGIDTGPIINRQSYPMPDAGMNVDLIYDPAIRADLLCRTLAQFSETGEIKAELSQTIQEGTTYFEIHPVLKHVALLSLERGAK